MVLTACGLLLSDCEQNGSGRLRCTSFGCCLVRRPSRRRVGLDIAQGQAGPLPVSAVPWPASPSHAPTSAIGCLPASRGHYNNRAVISQGQEGIRNGRDMSGQCAITKPATIVWTSLPAKPLPIRSASAGVARKVAADGRFAGWQRAETTPGRTSMETKLDACCSCSAHVTGLPKQLF